MLLALLGTLFLLGIGVDGGGDRLAKVDLLVVPGSQVHPDGTLSQNLLGRLEAALEYHRTGLCRRILVSGGTGVEGRDESLAMRDFLLANGVADSVVVVDGEGINTLATARFAARWLNRQHATRVAVASSFFHISRLRLALRRQGFPVSGQIHSRRYELRDLYSILREAPALVKYAIDPGTSRDSDRTSPPLPGGAAL